MALRTDIPEMCNDSPRRKLIVQLHIGFAEGRMAKVMPFLSDDVVWDMAGGKTLHGSGEVSDFLLRLQQQKADRLVIQHMVTHGKLAACNGILQFGSRELRFAGFYEFTSAGSATVKKITSYVLSQPL